MIWRQGMGFAGFYGGGFPVAMTNSIVFGLGRFVLLFEDLVRETFLGRALAHPDTRPHVVAYSGDGDFADPSRMIAEEIKGSLTSWPFDPMGQELVSRGCAVCLSEFEIGESVFQLPRCSHIFHKGCLGKWLDCHQTTCPLCRSSFLTEQLSKKLRDREEEELADASRCGNDGWNRFY